VLTIGLTPGVALAENDNDCVRYGQGYWKQWLADEENDDVFDLDGHRNADLLAVLNTPARGGNANVILSYQFIAAALNVAVEGCEMPGTVQDAFDNARHYLHVETGAYGRSDALHWKDILEFWNENKYAELLSVWYEGTGCTFGTHEGDTLTLTFSKDIFRDGTDLKMYFKDATPYLPEVAVVTWAISYNVLTLTANGTFITPRPEVGDFVTQIEGLVKSCGCPVVVPDGGVEVVAMTYHYHWGPGVPYGATEEVPAVAIVDACGMEVWWYSDGSLISEGWYHDIYSVAEMSGWSSGNPANWNEPVKYLFSVHFPGVTLAWYSRTAIAVDDVREPVEGSILLPLP
ncbi:MAG: hypothetical protein ACNA7X_04860, partial [Dehalococcoidia bacterium]